jgi:hypothetical protein
MAESDAAAGGLERKLATILSADVAAYSRLMAEDEERTLQTFRAHKEVFEKLVELHRGRVFNTAGDAILAEAHCFEAQAVVLGNRISGEWPGRDPGVTIYLAGEISRSGEVAIHMHSKRADGSSFAVSDLIGTVHDGRIDAKGSFHDGRGVTLNWSKN